MKLNPTTIDISKSYLGGREGIESLDGDLVVGPHLVVVGRVGERQGKETLERSDR